MTKRSLTEQIFRQLKGGNVRNSSQLHEKDIEAAIVQVASTLFKAEVVAMNGQWTSIPSHCFTATYTATVTDVGCGMSEATMPVQPIMLPMNVGIFSVYSEKCYDPFIPLEPGMLPVVNKVNNTALAAMLGKMTAYSPSGIKLRFNKTVAEIGETVNMQLIVNDMAELGDNDPLPIPQDMEANIVTAVVKMLGQRVPHDTAVDNQDIA